jgi:hypothetical protein
MGMIWQHLPTWAHKTAAVLRSGQSKIQNFINSPNLKPKSNISSVLYIRLSEGLTGENY